MKLETRVLMTLTLSLLAASAAPANAAHPDLVCKAAWQRTKSKPNSSVELPQIVIAANAFGKYAGETVVDNRTINIYGETQTGYVSIGIKDKQSGGVLTKYNASGYLGKDGVKVSFGEDFVPPQITTPDDLLKSIYSTFYVHCALAQ